MSSDSKTLILLKQLIAIPSITPHDLGCQKLIADRLLKSGFEIFNMPFGDVSNLWAVKGKSKPLFVFAGHTDVVPTGSVTAWTSPPFEPTIRDGLLYGRGSADMKASIAAMVIACEQFIEKNPNHLGSIAFLLTSDEEGPGINGTKKVIEQLTALGIQIQYCLVGEPTSDQKLADVIKNGRRGSLHGNLSIIGKQGHVAYPERALNPIHQSLVVLNDIINHPWDAANETFPKTSLQISNIHAGTGAVNVIPNTLECTFNFRFGTQTNPDHLKKQVEHYLIQHKLQYHLSWELSSIPFLCVRGDLETAVQKAIQDQLGYYARPSTDGGTSDARFFAPTGAEVIELGPLNASIHAIDEHVLVADLEKLTLIYENILKNLFIEP